MARTTKKKEVTPVVTRAEKKDATKNLIREFLQKQQYKHNDLIDEVAKAYTERFSGEDTDNINDVKGRVGSVLDIMKKDGDVTFDGGVYAMKTEEKPQKTTRRTKKAVAEEQPNEKAEEAPKKTVKRTSKKTTAKKEAKEMPSEEKKAEETEEVLPLPPAPIQPIAPVAPITPEVAPEPLPEKPKKAVKRTTKKAAAKTEAKAEEKAAEKIEEKPQEVAESKTETAKTHPEEKHSEPVKAEEKLLEKPVETPAEKPTEKPATAEAKPLMDMSFLFGDPKAKPTPKKQPEKAEKTEEPAKPKQVQPPQKTEQKKEEVAVKPVEQKPVVKKEAATVQKPVRESVRKVKKPAPKAMTADEKLKEAFLKRMRQLGGDYFEYYSVYLLEKYSRRNGRRLEGLKITGGDHDGGIDGEIELTDKFGFRETIYIQSKNWDPDKGDEKLWVVGETLVQQFIGACICRQAKDKKQHCRGIFITTSRFTPDAKSMLDEMSDKVVGYDGNDLYETAKECEFGLVKKNGEWSLDEDLLSGSKAFFNMI